MARKKDLENFEEIRPPFFLTIQALLLIGILSSAAALDVQERAGNFKPFLQPTGLVWPYPASQTGWSPLGSMS
jgi:hypothetical protein